VTSRCFAYVQKACALSAKKNGKKEKTSKKEKETVNAVVGIQ
jgi:hypothetical protein